MKIQFKQWNVVIFLIMSLSINGQNKLYWANKYNPSQINVSNIDGTDTKTILTENLPQYHFLDTINSKIYWTDKGMNGVIQCNLDGSNQVEIIKGLINPKGIYIDSLSQFYIVDDTKILVYSKSGLLLSTFISDLKKPNDILIHKGIVYWGNQEDHTIEYKPLNSGSKKVLLSGAYNVTDIEINKLTNEIYYTVDSGLFDSSGIFKADLDGKNIKQLIQGFTAGFAINAEEKLLYWGSGIFACIYKASFNNLSNPERFVTEQSNPFRIIINKKDNKFYFLDFRYGNFLFTANLTLGGYSSVALAGSKVYNPVRFEIDTINNKIYWVNSNSSFSNDNFQSIMVANLDGSGIKQLIKSPKVKNPHGIALDVKNNKIYWTDSGTSTIGVMNLDGSNDKVLIKDLMRPYGLKLFNISKKLYWTDWGTKKIMKSDLDGTNIEEIINLNASTSLDLDLSNELNKIFWTVNNDGTINSANLDGSNITKVVDTGSAFNSMDAIFIDDTNSKLYFSDNRRIYESNIDGSNLNILKQNVSPSDICIINAKSSSIVEHENKIRVMVYPNPMTNVINLSSNSLLLAIEIIDIYGKSILKELNINQNNHHINTENYDLSSGLYFIKIESNDGSFIQTIFKI